MPSGRTGATTLSIFNPLRQTDSYTMPAISSPRHSAAGTYRTFSTTSADRSYYPSSATSSYIAPRIKTYSERFTTRTYTDETGKRVFSRQGSITEDGVTTRFREEGREPSVRRDSLREGSYFDKIGSGRNNSGRDSARDSLTRENSVSRDLSRSESRGRISTLDVIDSVADLRNKYSPANYVPACLRKNENALKNDRKLDNGSGYANNVDATKMENNVDSNSVGVGNVAVHSNSIADIGRPPVERFDRTSIKKKVNTNVNVNTNGVTTNSTNNSTTAVDNDCEDDNGNLSVAEIRKKFGAENCTEQSYARPSANRSRTQSLRRDSNTNDIDGTENGIGITTTTTTGKENVKNATVIKPSDAEMSTKQLIEEPAKSSRATKEHAAKTTDSLPKAEQRISKITGKPIKVVKRTGAGDVIKKTSSKQNAETKKSKDDKKVVAENKTLKPEVSGKCPEVIALPPEVIEVDGEIIGNGVEISCDIVDAPAEPNGTVSDEIQARQNHTTNFASYIPAKAFQQGDITVNGTDVENGASDEADSNERKYSLEPRTADAVYDLSSSPRLSRPALSHASAPGSSSGSSGITSATVRNSLDRDRNDERSWERPLGSGTVRNAGLNGLKNIGNTCFMNSVIQCLSNTRYLLEYVRNDVYLSDINTSISSMKGALIKAFSQVIQELWSQDTSDRVVNTLSLKSQIQRFAPRFMGYQQQDAQEFLRYLLEGLHEDVNRVTSKPAPIHTEIDESLSDNQKAAESWQRYLRMDNSRVVDIFVGQLKSTLRCTHCGHCSVTFDPFWDLSLPIPQRQGPLRLQQCLEHFTREETLDGDEKPTCSKCQQRRKCTKSFSIQKFPKILVIHLKRFSPTERFRGKLSVVVDFPLQNLDLSSFAASKGHTECVYNLYAISNHSGTTYSGHYTAYCKHPYSGEWHEYNDSRVSPISPRCVVSGEAYVLFYELVGQHAHL